MAAVTERPVSFYNDTAYAEWTYDDVTFILASVRTHNSTPTRVGSIKVTDSTTGTVLLTSSIPTGDRTLTPKASIRVDQLNITASL